MRQSDLEIDDYRLSETNGFSPKMPSRKRAPKHRRGEPFLKGPVPWNWLSRAMALPGKALHVALTLWMQYGCNRDKSATVRFCLSRMEQCGISKQTARRALRELEQAELIEVHQQSGKCLAVTLLECPNLNAEKKG